MRKHISPLLAAIGLLAVLALGARMQDEKLKPSDAYNEFNTQFSKIIHELKPGPEYAAKRAEMAGQFADRCAIEGLEDDSEWVMYAELLYIANRIEEARVIYERVAGGSGDAARKASQGLLNVFGKKEDWSALEQGIADFRKRFPPTPEDTQYLYSGVYRLASHYQEIGDLKKATDLILDEFSSLSTDAPYMSLSLPKYWVEAFIEAGRSDDLVEAIGAIAPRLRAAIDEREANAPENDPNYENATRMCKMHLGSMLSVKTQLAVIGQPAPNIDLSHQVNTDISSLADLRGKVVIIDFWANWCVPCKASFPHMRKLYEEYNDRGLVVLGVTSIQGMFLDRDIKEMQVEENRELELTADLIKHYQMTWPLGFSSRSVFDPEYGVDGIPTFAVIDRKGIVRAIRTGSGFDNKEFLDHFIPQLLAEEE